jgi:hypothetical protein
VFIRIQKKKIGVAEQYQTYLSASGDHSSVRLSFMIVHKELAGGIDNIMVCNRSNQIELFFFDINIMKF